MEVCMVALLLGSSFLITQLWAADEPLAAGSETRADRLNLQVEREVNELPEFLLEFSFGSSLVYVEQPLLDSDSVMSQKRVLPVPSVLILAEWLIRPRWKVAALVNIPTSPIRVLDETGTTYTEEASTAAIAIGGSYVPFQVRIGEKSVFQPQIGLMVGRTVNHSVEDGYFPMAVARLHVHTNEGFTMYAGAAFAGRRDTLALLYGVGHRF
jgi:hypothetical protein